MGFRVLLIAVTGKDPEAVHQDYGVVASDEFEEIPESPVVGAMLPSGAYLLYVNDEIVPDGEVLSKLSRNVSLISCYANETVMNSLASSWVNGEEQWSVFHDAQQGTKHLSIEGNPPGQLRSIQENAFAQQDEAQNVDHVFAVPVDLFATLGGLRYDQDIPGAGPTPWRVLVRTKDNSTAKKKWWQFR